MKNAAGLFCVYRKSHDLDVFPHRFEHAMTIDLGYVDKKTAAILAKGEEDPDLEVVKEFAQDVQLEDSQRESWPCSDSLDEHLRAVRWHHRST